MTDAVRFFGLAAVTLMSTVDSGRGASILIDDFKSDRFYIRERFDLDEGDTDQFLATHETAGNPVVRERTVNITLRGPGEGQTYLSTFNRELRYTYGRSHPNMTSDLSVSWRFREPIDTTKFNTLLLDFGTYLVLPSWDSTLEIRLDARDDFTWEIPYERIRGDWFFPFPESPEEIHQLRLRFKNLGTFNDGYWVGLEGVRLVPEPRGVTLVLFGLLFGFFAKKRWPPARRTARYPELVHHDPT